MCTGQKVGECIGGSARYLILCDRPVGLTKYAVFGNPRGFCAERCPYNSGLMLRNRCQNHYWSLTGSVAGGVKPDVGHNSSGCAIIRIGKIVGRIVVMHIPSATRMATETIGICSSVGPSLVIKGYDYGFAGLMVKRGVKRYFAPIAGSDTP